MEGIYSNLVFILLLTVTELFPVWVIANITSVNTDMFFAHSKGRISTPFWQASGCSVARDRHRAGMFGLSTGSLLLNQIPQS